MINIANAASFAFNFATSFVLKRAFKIIFTSFIGSTALFTLMLFSYCFSEKIPFSLFFYDTVKYVIFANIFCSVFMMVFIGAVSAPSFIKPALNKSNIFYSFSKYFSGKSASFIGINDALFYNSPIVFCSSWGFMTIFNEEFSGTDITVAKISIYILCSIFLLSLIFGIFVIF